VGDYFQYVIDHKVTLPRQKSALLPIVMHDVEATRVSIFNEGVQAKFPLLGLKFKNTSGQNLMQGPVTVYEGKTYAGDARVQDLQPGEERLVAYAVDQGTEVKAEGQTAPQQLVAVKVVKGVLQATHKLRETKNYLIKNRSPQARTLIVEHPVRADWRLVTPEKPAERSRESYRFEVQVPAGKSLTQQVVEEQSRVDQIALGTSDDRVVRVFLRSSVPSARVKESLEKAVTLRSQLTDTQRELAQLQGQLKAIADDQTRLRANFERLPPTSAAYKRYLEKFDKQETEIETLQGTIKKLQGEEHASKKSFEDYLANFTAE
jgi:dynactin complex subunit